MPSNGETPGRDARPYGKGADIPRSAPRPLGSGIMTRWLVTCRFSISSRSSRSCSPSQAHCYFRVRFFELTHSERTKEVDLFLRLVMMAVITATLFASLEAMREGWGPLAAALVTTGLALFAASHLRDVSGRGARLPKLAGFGGIGVVDLAWASTSATIRGGSDGPARVRSIMVSRSSWAIAAMMVSMAAPIGPSVCRPAGGCGIRSLGTSTAPPPRERVGVLRPRRSSFQTVSTSRQFFVCCHTYVSVTKSHRARAWESLSFDGFGNSLCASSRVLRIGSD